MRVWHILVVAVAFGVSVVSGFALKGFELQKSMHNFVEKYENTDGTDSLSKWNALEGDKRVNMVTGAFNETKVSLGMKALFLAGETGMYDGKVSSLKGLCKYVTTNAKWFVSAGDMLIQTYYECVNKPKCFKEINNHYLSSLFPFRNMGFVCESTLAYHRSQSVRRLIMKNSLLFGIYSKSYDPTFDRTFLSDQIEDYGRSPDFCVQALMAKFGPSKPVGPHFGTILQKSIFKFAVVNKKGEHKLAEGMTDESATGLGVIIGIGAVWGDAIPQPFLGLFFDAIICLEVPGCDLKKNFEGFIDRPKTDNTVRVVNLMVTGYKSVLHPYETLATISELKSMAAKTT